MDKKSHLHKLHSVNNQEIQTILIEHKQIRLFEFNLWHKHL
jgi:hypothetical protein